MLVALRIARRATPTGNAKRSPPGGRAGLEKGCGKILPVEFGEHLCRCEQITFRRVAGCGGMWILRTITEEVPEKTFRLLPGGVRTLGRAVGADFIVDAALVSRVHCRFTVLPDGSLELRDLDSTNGTFVNGHRIDATRLSPGDRMQIGRVELVALREES